MKQVTVDIKLYYSKDEEGVDIQTHGVPTSLVLESLNTIVKGLARQLVEDAAEVIPSPDQEKYFDSRLELDRKLLEDLIDKAPEVKEIDMTDIDNCLLFVSNWRVPTEFPILISPAVVERVFVRFQGNPDDGFLIEPYRFKAHPALKDEYFYHAKLGLIKFSDLKEKQP